MGEREIAGMLPENFFRRLQYDKPVMDWEVPSWFDSDFNLSFLGPLVRGEGPGMRMLYFLSKYLEFGFY